jgi:hypothetical protein
LPDSGGVVTTPPDPLPCSAPQSGFTGDDQCILPPASPGFQLHFGPTSYDDPDVLAPFMVLPGDEQDHCVFLHTPNTAPVDATAIHFRARSGFYNGSVSFLAKDRADSTAPEACGTDVALPWLAFSHALEDSTLGGDAPENRNLAWHVPAHAPVAFRVHSLNVTDTPQLQEAWLNVVPAAAGSVDPVAALELRGFGDSVPPRAALRTHFHCTAPAAIRVIELTAALSASVNELSASVVRAAGEKTIVYTTYDWNEPTALRYDSVTKNPEPNSVTKTAGGASGILDLAAGDSLDWECAITNQTDVTLRYLTGSPFTGITCDLHGVYAPAGATPWVCTSSVPAADGGMGPIVPPTGAGGAGTGANATGGASGTNAMGGATGTNTDLNTDAGRNPDTSARGVPKTEGGCGCRVSGGVDDAPRGGLAFVGAGLSLAVLGRRRVRRARRRV